MDKFRYRLIARHKADIKAGSSVKLFAKIVNNQLTWDTVTAATIYEAALFSIFEAKLELDKFKKASSSMIVNSYEFELQKVK